MKVSCTVCGWKGTKDELDTYDPAMDELPVVDVCPSCGAANIDAGTLPALRYVEEQGGHSMECVKCQSKNLDVVDSGPHKKLVCVDCLAFQKFLSTTDAKTFEQLKNKEVTT